MPDGGRDFRPLGNSENFLERIKDLVTFGALVSEIAAILPSNSGESHDFFRRAHALDVPAFFLVFAKFFLILRSIPYVPCQEVKLVGVRRPILSQLWP